MSNPNNNDEYYASQPTAKRLKLTTPTGSTAAPAPIANDPFDYKNLNYKRPDEVKKCMEMFKRRNVVEQGKWPRPQLKRPLDPKRDSVDLQVMDIDYINIENQTEFTRNLSNCELSKIPKIRMFGVTGEGHSVMVDVYGFMPYFYAPVPAEMDSMFFAAPDHCEYDESITRKDMDASHCSVMRNIMNHIMTDAVNNQYQRMNSTEYVVSVEIVSRIPTEGYRTTGSPFFKITMALPGHVATLRGKMEKGITIGTRLFPFLTYESSTVFASRFMIDTGMQGCSWVTVPAGKYTLLNPYEQTSTSQIEVAMNYLDIVAHQPVGEWLKFAPLRVLSFDIENYKVAGEFPVATVDRNMVTQISNILAICEGNSLTNVVGNVFTLGTSDSVGDLDIRMYLSEEELLEKWRDFVVMVDPDLITGYNILRFDLPYLWERAAHLKLRRFKYMSRITNEEVKMKEAKFQSKAFGKSKSFQFNMTGRILFDLLPVVLRNFKMRNNSLNAISTIFLNEQKEDVDHTQIGGLFAGSPSTRARLVSYCYKDSLLVLQIIDAQKLILPYIMMAMITGVPFAFLLSRGESVKVHTQLIRKARKDGFVTPTRIRVPGDTGEAEDDGFEGAVVIEPERAFYELPVATLDFESLYPSIMRAYNLCYTTWIQPHRIATVAADMTEGEKEDYIVTPKGHYFVTAKTFRGLLPAILDGLIAERGKVKKEMFAAEQAGDKVLEKILNARQLAIKVSANSVYGFTGATVGPLPCLPISESVTAYGRDMIHLTRDTVLNHYNIKNGYQWDSKVIYGDSVIGDTAILWRHAETKVIDYTPIDQLALESSGSNDWLPYHIDKEAITLPVHVQVWSDEGWTHIRRVIRHRTDKQIMRISTSTGSVDVTEDHSLLDEDGEKISPKEVRVGNKLLHSKLPVACEDDSLNPPVCTVDCAYAWGFFMSDGLSEESRFNKNVYWQLDTKDTSSHTRIINGLSKYEPKITFIVHKPFAFGAPYRMVAFSSDRSGGDEYYNDVLVDFVRRWTLMFYDAHRAKRVPASILNAPRDLRQAFWDGYFASAGGNDHNGDVQFSLKGQVGCAGLYYIANSLGYSTFINLRMHKYFAYQLTCTRNGKEQRRPADKIKKILPLGTTDDFVYDLETENHHFSAGVGRMIVHNTDSVMVVFGTDDLATSMAMGKEAAKLVTELFPPPIRLAFEKCYWPYLLSAKKRYAGSLWTKTTKPDKLDVKGMESVRRDNCLMVKKMVDKCLNLIVIERRPADAIAYCKQLVTGLVQNKIDLSQLVISKAFSREEADYKGVQPHIELNKKLAARKGKQQPYQVGDRIQYVVLKGNKKTPMSMRTEDPIYALENRLPVDPEFYIEMLSKPVERLLGVILKKINKNVSEIFVGDHTRLVTKTTPLPQKGLITMFTKVVKSCVQCKATLEPNESNPCQSCIANSNPVVKYLEVINELQVAENDYCRFMTHCQTCQGSRYEPIMCGARDCAIFYKRVSSKVALERATERVAMMTNPDDNKWEVKIHTATVGNEEETAAAAATASAAIAFVPVTIKNELDW